MSVAKLTEADADRARRIWAEFSSQNDLSERHGQTAGIDPATGRILFGESASEIFCRLKASGAAVPLYFVRVGYDYYLRKGGRH